MCGLMLMLIVQPGMAGIQCAFLLRKVRWRPLVLLVRLVMAVKIVAQKRVVPLFGGTASCAVYVVATGIVTTMSRDIVQR